MLKINNQSALEVTVKLGLQEAERKYNKDFGCLKHSLTNTLVDRFVCLDILAVANVTDYTEFVEVCKDVTTIFFLDTETEQYVLDCVLEAALEIIDFEEFNTVVSSDNTDEVTGLTLDIVVEEKVSLGFQECFYGCTGLTRDIVVEEEVNKVVTYNVDRTSEIGKAVIEYLRIESTTNN